MLRSHISSVNELEIRDYLQVKGETFKPHGLWYGIDDSWFEFIRGVGFREWVGHNEFEIEVDLSKMIVLNNRVEMDAFHEKYSFNPFSSPESPTLSSKYFECIEWNRVCEDYSGIEINVYKNPRYFWHWSWDVPSGCIWKKDAIKNISKTAKLLQA